MAEGEEQEMMGMQMYDDDDGEEADEVDAEEYINEKSSGEITPEQREYIKTIYYHGADKNESGALSLSELRRGLQALGMNPTISEVKKIMKKHEIEGKKIEYDQFEKIIAEEAIGNSNAEFDLIEAFRIFDKDGSGTLEREELGRCLTVMGECLSDNELTELFDTLDKNKDGKLSMMEASKLLAN